MKHKQTLCSAVYLILDFLWSGERKACFIHGWGLQFKLEILKQEHPSTFFFFSFVYLFVWLFICKTFYSLYFVSLPCCCFWCCNYLFANGVLVLDDGAVPTKLSKNWWHYFGFFYSEKKVVSLAIYLVSFWSCKILNYKEYYYKIMFILVGHETSRVMDITISQYCKLATCNFTSLREMLQVVGIDKSIYPNLWYSDSLISSIKSVTFRQ